MAAGLERRLLKTPVEMDTYNDALKDFIERGTLREISDEEMASWDGHFNYISHHGVAKPGSVTTS